MNEEMIDLFFLEVDDIEYKIEVIDVYIDTMGWETFYLPLLITFSLLILPSVIEVVKLKLEDLIKYIYND